MTPINPDNVIIRFNCPNNCSNEIYDVTLSEYMDSGIPHCSNCEEQLEYAETTIREENFKLWLEENPGTDRFWCEEHGAYEASKSYCNSCQKELPIDRDEYISQLVNADWDSLDSRDVENIFRENQREYYDGYSNEQLKTALEER